MTLRRLIVFGFLFSLVWVGGISQAEPQSKVYVDPGRAFAIQIPSSWITRRADFGDDIWVTELTTGDSAKARIEIIVMPWEEDFTPDMLDEMGGDMIMMASELINSNGTITSQRNSRVTFGGRTAIRSDITYRDNTEPQPRKGYMLVLLGKRNALLALISASQADSAGLDAAEQYLGTLALESAQPQSLKPVSGATGATGAGPKPATFFTASNLSSTAKRIKANLKRDSHDAVLVRGNPPLTYGSVANFVNVVCYCFDIQFTEAEFEATRERFIEFYNKSDAQGKAQIALGGASLWKGLHEGTADQKAQAKEEVKTVMAQRFAAGAQAGIEWARALHEAIELRSTHLSATRASVPNQFRGETKLDGQMTEADLNAAVELLYFFWVAGGRDANQVTPAALQQIRTYLATNFARFDPTVQYLLANGEKLYAAVRQTYQMADANQRVYLAQQYNQALDQLLGTGGSGGGGGGNAWSDASGSDPSTVRAELAMNNAYLAANATSFSGRTQTW